jgi:subtilisin family serine protease
MAHRPARSVRSAAALIIAVALLIPVVAPSTASAGDGRPSPRGSGDSRGALLVRLRSGADPTAVAAAVSAVGGTRIGQLDEVDMLVVQVPAGRQAQAREQLRANPAVAFVEDDREASIAMTPNDPLWSRQWSARKVRGPFAWDVTTGGNGPIVAVLDTGVDGKHPDLAGRLVPGWNFHDDSANTFDNGNHGTAVAALVAGRGNNGVGIAGMCWRCRIMPVKVADANGRANFSNVAAGVIWATRNGARVINISLGYTSGSVALREAVAYAIARGAVVVASAGNEGNRRAFYPAYYPNVLSVAATTSTDGIYSFSTRGAWVDVGAPGCTWSAAPRGRWRSFCGTSAAAPIVAGIAGLVISRAPSASRRAVTAAITSTSVRIGPAVINGRVDAAAAVRALGSAVSTPGGPTEGSASWADRLSGYGDRDQRRFWFGGVVRFNLSWSNRQDLRVVIRDRHGRRVARWEDDGHWRDGANRDDFEVRLPYGYYTLEVSSDYNKATDFALKVRWHDD